MIDTRLRKFVQPAFDEMSKGLVKIKATPDGITVAAFIVGLGAGILTAYAYFAAAFVLLWVSGLLDVLDGSVARLQQTASKRGAYMDLVFDRMVEAGIIMGFYFAFPAYTLAYLLFFVSVLFNFTTFMVAGSLFPNTGEKSMHYDVGIAERTETFIVFSLMMCFPQAIGPLLMGFNGIIFLTGCIRFYRIIKFSEK